MKRRLGLVAFGCAVARSATAAGEFALTTPHAEIVAALTPVQNEAAGAHVAYLRRLIPEKRIGFGAERAGRRERPWFDDDVFRRGSGPAEALVCDDPAVKSGVLAYEPLDSAE